mmetsp:Transcript_90291/g.151003  ORF Transcript_90291/g.151003 Transcript_90291/m.151003 type:complete len:98 (-) Transcript_90291:1040-1333(-)
MHLVFYFAASQSGFLCTSGRGPVSQWVHWNAWFFALFFFSLILCLELDQGPAPHESRQIIKIHDTFSGENLWLNRSRATLFCHGGLHEYSTPFESAL